MERLLISLIFHCSKDDKHDRAIQDLHASFKGRSCSNFVVLRLCANYFPFCVELRDVEFELLKAPATACITVRGCSIWLIELYRNFQTFL